MPARGANAAVRRVGPDHDEPPRQPFGDHAADEQRRDLRERPGRERESHIGGRSAHAEDGEGNRDRREVRPEEGNCSGRKEQAEAPPTQDFKGSAGEHAPNDPIPVRPALLIEQK